MRNTLRRKHVFTELLLQDPNCVGQTQQVVKHMILWGYNLDYMNKAVSTIGPCGGQR